MSFTIKNLLSLTVLATALLAGCNRDHTLLAKLEDSQDNAFVKVMNFAPNFRQVMNNNRDSFNVFAGADKINGTFLTYNALFPIATSNNYIALPSGNQLFRLSVHGVTTPDSINLYSSTRNLKPGMRYSFLITDSIRSANPAKQMFLEDNFAIPAEGKFGLRLIHAVHNDTAAGRTVDVFSVKQGANIFTNVPAGSATGFLYFPIPTTSGGDTLIVRRNNTLFEITRVNGMIQGNGRVYSLVYRGSALTTGVKARGLTSYLNY